MSRSITTGFKELDRELQRLPNKLANRLQGAVIRNHLDHRNEVINSSKLTAEGKRNIKFAIRVFPGSGGTQRNSGGKSKTKRVNVRRIKDVFGETVSFWKGADSTVAEGAAARIEKTIGKTTIRAKKKRLLFIPQGDFTTRTGRPRRKRVGGRLVALDPRALKDTFTVRTGRGTLLVVQHLKGGKAGTFERQGARERGGKLGGARGLGSRTRVVGILKKQVKGSRGLDFFKSWNRLQGKRTDRYTRLLDDVLRKGSR